MSSICIVRKTHIDHEKKKKLLGVHLDVEVFIYKIWCKIKLKNPTHQASSSINMYGTDREHWTLFTTFCLIFFFFLLLFLLLLVVLPKYWILLGILLCFCWKCENFIPYHCHIKFNSIDVWVMCNSFLKWKQKWKYLFWISECYLICYSGCFIFGLCQFYAILNASVTYFYILE